MDERIEEQLLFKGSDKTKKAAAQKFKSFLTLFNNLDTLRKKYRILEGGGKKTPAVEPPTE